MIKETELRIGNLFEVYNNLFNRVDAISAEKIRFKNSKGTFYVDPESANPIPLTPEILERCNFENGFHVTYNKDSYKEHGRGVFWFQRKEGYGSPVTKQVVYLHKLQNLYYDHADCELEIK